MGYKLTCHYDANSDFIDPRLNVALITPLTDEPVEEWNIPFSAHALRLVMAYAQKWMSENVYNTPCASKAEAEARNLDTSAAEYFIIRNPTGGSETEIQTKNAMTRLIRAAKKHGLDIAPYFDLFKKR